ncbi:MAG TPA: peptide-methionine (R)-S-oxide reductase MsrB [Solirubrobacteraceae bacterium]
MSENEAIKSDEQWREELTPEQYEVLRRSGTEAPFTGEYVYNKSSGMYRCAGCGSDLFSSETKFESGTGWPSFTEPAVAETVELRPDNGLFMRRTEVVCRTCGGHLGHVFDDGPSVDGGPPTQRYCINSAALAFQAAEGDAPDPGGEPDADSQ